MKTVPTLRVVSKSDTADQLAGLGVADLPGEVQVVLADVASVAREGLLAVSVAAGMAVMQDMFDAEIAALCGAKGRHDPDRTASRHGREKGSVVLGRQAGNRADTEPYPRCSSTRRRSGSPHGTGHAVGPKWRPAAARPPHVATPH